jgi:hypothetical protein
MGEGVSKSRASVNGGKCADFGHYAGPFCMKKIHLHKIYANISGSGLRLGPAHWLTLEGLHESFA